MQLIRSSLDLSFCVLRTTALKQISTGVTMCSVPRRESISRHFGRYWPVWSRMSSALNQCQTRYHQPNRPREENARR